MFSALKIDAGFSEVFCLLTEVTSLATGTGCCNTVPSLDAEAWFELSCKPLAPEVSSCVLKRFLSVSGVKYT